MTSLYDQELATREYGEEQRDEGKEEGFKENQHNTVKRMLLKGKLSDQDVAEYSGLSLEEVKNIRKDMFAHD